MHRRNGPEVVRRGLITGVLAVALLLTAACGSEGDDVALTQGASPTPTPAAGDASPTPTTSGSGGDQGSATFEGGTEDVILEGGQGEVAVLEEVRVARQDGFDRVVWEFSTGESPTVRVGYDDRPLEPGRGEPIDVAGPTSLVVGVQPATDLGAELHAPDHDPYAGPERFEGTDTEVVTEVVRMGDFEANLQWAVGTEAERPFRVDVLSDPLRVVVDIGH